MCLIVFALDVTTRYRLVLAANRDEFFARPTRPAGWSADERVLAGRDLRGGGTWMGVTRDGRFAALTNHRDPRSMRSDAPSRGLLCDRVLLDDAPPLATLGALAADAGRFNGFNLLAGRWSADKRDVAIGILADDRPVARAIGPGLHGLSNARLDTPWPKVERARARLGIALADEPPADVLVTRLLDALADQTIAADASLPETGVSLATERALSAAFIRQPAHLPDYGTRSSTVLLVDTEGRVTFVERRHAPDAGGAAHADGRFTFEVSGARAS